jgi:hypothetical protein
MVYRSTIKLQRVFINDLNQDYLDTAYKRYKEDPHSAIGEAGYNSTFRKSIYRADLIWAALVLIYGLKVLAFW